MKKQTKKGTRSAHSTISTTSGTLKDQVQQEVRQVDEGPEPWVHGRRMHASALIVILVVAITVIWHCQQGLIRSIKHFTA